MSSHSQAASLMFNKKKQHMKVEDIENMARDASKDKVSTKGRSQDADRHAKTHHPKSDK